MPVLIELDEKLITRVDEAAENLHKSRLDFINETLQEALWRQEIEEKERRTIESYRRFPQQPEEYEIWQNEQVWEDE
ncbi:MAG: hypothetical protein M3Q78_04750 [Acidobacteriota bacterium]|nr:hypothetical protein [Acidobacteriota bacterium]